MSNPQPSIHRMLTRARARTRRNPNAVLRTLTSPRRPRPVIPPPRNRQPPNTNFYGDPALPHITLGSSQLDPNREILNENGVDCAHETHMETNVDTGGWNLIFPAGMRDLDRELRKKEERKEKRKRGAERMARGVKRRRRGERDGRGRWVKREDVKEDQVRELVEVVEVEREVAKWWSVVLGKWVEERNLFLAGEERVEVGLEQGEFILQFLSD